MDNYTVLDENQRIDEVSEFERSIFYKKTYGHVALGVLAFFLIENI